MRLKTTVKTALLGPPGERVRTVRGGLLRGLEFPIDTSWNSMQLVGLAEREIVHPVRAMTARAQVACDIGANAGWYALFFASRPNIQRVFAFEADVQFAPIIRENLERNDETFAAKATVVSKFVGNRDDARWCKLDTVLGEINQPLMLKIDVDGGELEVLKGAQRLLENLQCFLVIETHSEQLERDCADFLRALHYNTRIIKNGWYRLFFREGRTIPHNRWLSASKSH